MEGRLQIVITIIQILINLFNITIGRIVFFNRIKPCKNNKTLKNSIHGKRCFILGNGPSLNKQDLSLLDGEIVFTVNQVLRNKQYGRFKSSFHFWMDNNFFVYDKQNPEDEELLGIMRDTANQSGVKCFYPYDKQNYLIENNISMKNAFFLYPALKMHPKYKLKPRIDNYVPGFGTVVLYAVYVAIYMGASEIYLLGCDETGIESTINSVLKTNNNTYSYDISDNEKLRMEKMVARSSMLQYAYSYYGALKGFDNMKDYCLRRNVKLINLSAQSVLDMIPSEPLDKVIQK